MQPVVINLKWLNLQRIFLKSVAVSYYIEKLKSNAILDFVSGIRQYGLRVVWEADRN